MKQVCLAILTALLALTVVSPASAQYIWLDKNNVKVYSDKAPPPDIPNNRVLKGPRGYKAKNIEVKYTDGTEPPAPEAKAASAPGTPKPPMTTAEKNAEFNKRRMEQAEKEKKAAQEEKNRQAKAENCERARAYHRALQTGQRISRTNASGGKDYMGDEERARETSKVEETLRECN
ncbi:MAG: DUF4124 domain-containing protein [Oxalobacter sp.]|nr:MAG: DUF4124 domain-containing protein [Oxalobacter sp.]